jgi:hypothetical protein
MVELASSLIASVSELPIAGLMLFLEHDAGLSRKEVDALGLGTGDGLGETSGDDATVIGRTSRRGKTKLLSFRAGREWFRIAMVAYSGCDVVSVGSFAWKRREEEGERKEKEDRERRWNVLIFRQHKLHPDHFPPSIVTLLAVESRRHQCPVPNGGINCWKRHLVTSLFTRMLCLSVSRSFISISINHIYFRYLPVFVSSHPIFL